MHLGGTRRLLHASRQLHPARRGQGQPVPGSSPLEELPSACCLPLAGLKLSRVTLKAREGEMDMGVGTEMETWKGDGHMAALSPVERDSD